MHLAVFGDLQLLFEFFTQVGGVDHGCVFIDGAGDFVREVRENKFGSGKSNGAVSTRGLPPSRLHVSTRWCRKLPDQFVIRTAMQAADAAAIAPAARGHNARLRAG